MKRGHTPFTGRAIDDRTIAYVGRVDGRALTFAQVMRALQEDQRLRDALTRTIADAPFGALFWECAPMSAATKDEPFAMIVMQSAALTRAVASPAAFDAQIGGCDGPEVRRFGNLGGDARLVVPCRAGPSEWYGHIATFAREAPRAQADQLWQAVGAEVERWWDDTAEPLWLSTSGLGVPWLHVRLDERPKYVCHVPYRRAPR